MALRVVELLRDQRPSSLLSAEQVGERLGRSRDFVYTHAEELGAVALGNGPRPRLGFPPECVDAYVAARRTERTAESTAAQIRRPRRRRTEAQGGRFLAIRGRRPPR